jgi:hypothetical protein
VGDPAAAESIRDSLGKEMGASCAPSSPDLPKPRD